MAIKATTVDDYICQVTPEQRQALQTLRESIQSLAPDAEECISYGLPAFRQKKILVGFGATAKHCALYLFSGSVVEQFAEELSSFDTSKGTIRFLPQHPLPKSLLKKLVKARIAENNT